MLSVVELASPLHSAEVEGIGSRTSWAFADSAISLVDGFGSAPEAGENHLSDSLPLVLGETSAPTVLGFWLELLLMITDGEFSGFLSP